MLPVHRPLCSSQHKLQRERPANSELIKQAVGYLMIMRDIRALLIEDWWFGAKEDALLRSESSFGPVQFQDTANADHASASDPEY